MTFDSLKNSSLLTSGTGIVALASTTPLDTAGAHALMSNTFTLYANSNIKSDTQATPPVYSFIQEGSGTTTLTNLYNGKMSKSIG